MDDHLIISLRPIPTTEDVGTVWSPADVNAGLVAVLGEEETTYEH
jgi:hypothetical protein